MCWDINRYHVTQLNVNWWWRLRDDVRDCSCWVMWWKTSYNEWKCDLTELVGRSKDYRKPSVNSKCPEKNYFFSAECDQFLLPMAKLVIIPLVVEITGIDLQQLCVCVASITVIYHYKPCWLFVDLTCLLLQRFVIYCRTRRVEFNELARIFSDDDNQRRCREILDEVSNIWISFACYCGLFTACFHNILLFTNIYIN